jgi:hypothetical protein
MSITNVMDEEKSSSPLSNGCDSFGNPLFESKGTKKHWNFVRLVAKKGSDVKLVTSKDAIRAFCLLCQKHITYTKGNGNSVYRHVEKNHKTELEELDFKRKELGKSGSSDELSEPRKKKLKSTSVSEYFTAKNIMKASKEDQLHGEALLVKWISQHLRPFKIVEDAGFVDLCKFLCQLRGQFQVPSRNKTRNQMMRLAQFVMERVKQSLTTQMDYYSLTTDIWSSRVMQSYFALTLHYVTENFELKSCVLEVKPLSGSHTAEFNTFISKMILWCGGETIDSSFHELLLLLENGLVFPALRLHLNVFSLIAVLR